MKVADLPPLLSTITYVIPVEDGDPYKASLLQGFAPSLIENSPIIRIINSLPSDLWELTPDGHEVRLSRRMSGQAPVMWFGQSRRALTSMVTPIFAPFTVVFFGRGHNVSQYRKWIDSHTFPLTVVATEGGSIKYDELCVDALRNSFLNICKALDGRVQPDMLLEAKEALKSWSEPKPRILGYKLGGHNSVHPNLMALSAAGFDELVYGSFKDINNGVAPYVDQICRTTRSILNERAAVGEREANQLFRRPPSLNIFAPAIYPHITDLSLQGGPFSKEDAQRFLAVRRILEKQEGYAFQAAGQKQVEALMGVGETPRPHFLMTERSGELKLASECVATIAASEISAVLRMPNSVNRTLGQVRQFAQQYHAQKTTDRKRVDAFRQVQKTISESVPAEFLPFLEESSEGIRIISDAHLEWLPVKGLPLSIQRDTTRIPVTPGNLFLEQVSPRPYTHLSVSSFREVLVLSALKKEDPISRFFDLALGQFEPLFGKNVSIRSVRVRNRADLVSALNSFEGSMVVFDGHGGHRHGKPATLQLLDEEIDIWQLQSVRPRIPPIVILSACDTHAADRNHASSANGFLTLGAKSVLGSVFPIDARDAASFVARLLYRVAEFVPTAHRVFNRSLTWMEVISGMMRMQLLTDFCRRLEQKRIIDHQTYMDVHLIGNTAINSGLERWPFEVVVSELSTRGIDEEVSRRELTAAAANSTAISYLHLGRPETIIVHPNDGFTSDPRDGGAPRGQ